MFNKKLSAATYLLFIIIIIAAFFRLYNITQTPPGLYPDEAMNGTNAQETIATGNFKVFYPENNGREGLFINIQAISIMIFGNHPWALRGVSALFGIFTILGLYFLTKKLFEKFNSHYSLFKIHYSEAIALLSSFLLATSFWHINFSRIGFRAIMAPFFLVWAIYFILKSFDDSLNSKSCILNSILAGIFYGLGFYSYIAFRATPLIIAVIFIYQLVKNKDWVVKKRIFLVACLFSLVTILVFAPLGYYFMKHPADFMGRTTQVSVFSSPTPIKDLSLNIIKTAGMFNFVGDQNWRHNYSGNPELFWPVGIMFLVGIFFAIYYIFKKSSSTTYDLRLTTLKFPFLILLSWLITAMLPVVISNEGIPHALRSILMIPPVIILAGFGGILIYEKLNQIFSSKKSDFFLRLTSCVLLLIILLFAYKNYFIDWAHNSNTDGAFAKNYVDMGNQLNSLPRELPKYVIVEAGGADVRGLPMPTQTIMFITDTFTPEKQTQKNLFYVLPKNISQIPQGAFTIKLK
jgi:4-amino-4-deoxy-L-arabinose transferase-like glycosyltransferase